MKMNRMVGKMLLAVALIGAVTPTYAQTINQPRIGGPVYSVSFSSVLSVPLGLMPIDMHLPIPPLPPPPPPPGEE
jgi:hypothetical protein